MESSRELKSRLSKPGEVKPEPSLPLGEVKPEPSLPPGWRKEFSKKEKRHYFFNAKTKMSVWNLDDVMKEPNLLKQRNMESTNKLKDISLLEEKTGSDKDQILQMKILLEKLKSNKDQILPEKPKTNKNTVLLEKTKAKKNSKDKTKSNKEIQVNDDSSNLKESDIQDKVSPKPVKKKVDEEDFDLMLNISDTEDRFTDDDMEEEEEEKEKVQENLNCDMNQNTDSTEDIIPWVQVETKEQFRKRFEEEVKSEFVIPRYSQHQASSNLNNRSSADPPSGSNKPKGRYHRYIYTDFQASDKPIVDQSSPLFIKEVASQAISEFLVDNRTGDQTPERPSTPDIEYGANFSTSPSSSSANSVSGEDDLQEMKYSYELGYNHEEVFKSSSVYPGAMTEPYQRYLQPPGAVLAKEQPGRVFLSEEEKRIKLEEPEMYPTDQGNILAEEIREFMEDGGEIRGSEGGQMEETDLENLIFTEREEEMMEKEDLLNSKLQPVELLHVLAKTRVNQPPILNFDLKLTTYRILSHVVVLDTAVVMLYRHLVDEIKNMPGITVVLPALVDLELDLLMTTENIKIRLHAGEAKDWVLQEFKHSYSLKKTNKVGQDQVLGFSQSIFRIARNKIFKKCTVFSCEAEILSYSGKDQILVAHQDTILDTIQNRSLILEQMRIEEGEKVFNKLRNKLRDLLEVVLVSELEKLYDQHWIKIVKIKPAESKPFWNLTGLFDALRLHHEAVFTVYYPGNGSSLKRCIQSLTKADESNYTPRRKLDELIPGILQLCRIVEERGELPKSVYFPYSSFELARSTLEETKKIRKNWRGKSDERIKVESTDKEENEESEWMEQDERNYQGMEVEVKVGEFDDELEENEDEDDDDEEEEEDVCKTLLGNVWHMVACVTFSMCSIWDCKGDLDPVEPEYEFKDRREVEEMVEGFISQVQTIGKLMESLLKLRRCRRDLEQGWSEVTRLVPLLNTFRNNIKDDQGNWEAVTVTADQFIEYIRTEDELILESALKQLLMFLEALANLNQCIRNSNLVN